MAPFAGEGTYGEMGKIFYSEFIERGAQVFFFHPHSRYYADIFMKYYKMLAVIRAVDS